MENNFNRISKRIEFMRKKKYSIERNQLIHYIHELENFIISSKKSKNELKDSTVEIDEKTQKSDSLKRFPNVNTENKQMKKRKRERKFDFEKCSYEFIAIKFFYFGWNFHAFAQDSKGLVRNSVEDHLFDALMETKLIRDRQSSQYSRCGRTDKGVSAFSQVISLKIRKLDDVELYGRMLNGVLIPTIRIYSIWKLENIIDFSARFSCIKREYRYILPMGCEWLNIDQMEKASSYLLGTHDLRHLCRMDLKNNVTNFIRTISSVEFIQLSNSSTSSNGGEGTIYLRILANAFLYHEIRCIISILLLIGMNKEEPEIIERLLNEKELTKGTPNYNFASATPLILYKCHYENENWTSVQYRNVNEFILKEIFQLNIKMNLLKLMLNGIKEDFSHCQLEAIDYSKLYFSELSSETLRNYVKLFDRSRQDTFEIKYQNEIIRREKKKENSFDND
ncbi:hypothetical protein SNEBB_006242 [Seison nebaliae]|nr:hypothetical protein SNEBB_006242 [Seison nebaliae]